MSLVSTAPLWGWGWGASCSFTDVDKMTEMVPVAVNSATFRLNPEKAADALVNMSSTFKCVNSELAFYGIKLRLFTFVDQRHALNVDHCF